jgi:hypothetical protein
MMLIEEDQFVNRQLVRKFDYSIGRSLRHESTRRSSVSPLHALMSNA